MYSEESRAAVKCCAWSSTSTEMSSAHPLLMFFFTAVTYKVCRHDARWPQGDSE